MAVLARILTFFKERFSLQENVLWRVMSLLKPYKHWVIIANACVFLSQMLSAGGLIALQPLFARTLNEVSVTKPHAAGQKPENDNNPASMQSLSGGLIGGSDEEQDSTTTASTKVAAKAPPTRRHKPTKVDAALNKLKTRPGFWSKLINSNANTTESLQHPGLILRAQRKIMPVWEKFSTWANASTPRFIALYSAFLLGLLIINGIFEFFGDFLMAKISTLVTSDLMRGIYANTLNQELNFFNSQSTGSLLNTCYREVFDLQAMIQMLASTRVMLPIQMLTLFCALLYINARLSLLLVVMLPLIILPTFMLTRKIKRSLNREIDEETGAMDVMTQGFHGIQAIKAFGAEKLEVKYLEPPIQAYVNVSRARRAAQAIIGPVVDVLNMAVLLLVYVIALYIITNTKTMRHFEPSHLILFMIAITQFYKPMRDIMTMNVRMQRARAVSRRIFTLLDRKPLINDAPDAVPFPDPWKEMIFDHTYLTYTVIRKDEERHRRALRDVKIRIRRGEAIALIGPNGAGKSSIVNLICRLYEPTGGQILIDKTPLNQILLSQIREHICLITQHPVLFNRSVSENIAFGLDNISQEEIIEAAKATGGHNFISKLPQGYDSYVGEQGKLLSGGERQKIVLARAFVRHPEILILDEPTTGLDRQTTEEFLNLVSEMHRQGITVIYITHEYTQLARFQRIFQITPEKLVIEITHEMALTKQARDEERIHKEKLIIEKVLAESAE